VEAGIALDLADEADVADAIDTMRVHLGADAASVLVQEMVPPGVDMRIRAHHDERLGPVVTTGLGGLQADLIADEASRLVPISTSSARAMIADTRAAGALDDDAVERFAPVLTRVAQLMSDHPAIAELDLNPVIVSDDACVVVDAVVALRPSDHVDRAVRRLE
jgi:hypothetical protein